MPSTQTETNLVELIGDYTELKKAGWPWRPIYKGKCVFHKENSPSLVIEPNKKLWHCFGCGAGGDADSFMQQMSDKVD